MLGVKDKRGIVGEGVMLMRVLTWNIVVGGLQSQFYSIINHLLDHHADIIVLTEFVDNDKGRAIAKNLFAAGYNYQNKHDSPYRAECVFVASKIDFDDVTNHAKIALPYERWVELYFSEKDLYLLGVHIPSHMTSMYDRDLFFQQAIAYAKQHIEDRCLIIGDYNTSWMMDSQGTLANSGEYLKELNELGWMESWRFMTSQQKLLSGDMPLDYGFRIDYAYVSPRLQTDLIKCHLSTEPTLDGQSENEALLVDLNG